LEEVTYKNNELNGPYKGYKQNKLKVSANYLNGELHGKHIEYSYNSITKKNQIDVERVYDKGDVVSEIKYYENGKKERVWNFNGIYQSFFKNGQKQMETTFKDGEENGKRKEWLENGKIIQERTYKMGALLGTQIEYYPNDSIKVKQEYDTPNQLLSEILYTEAGKKIREMVRIKPETYLMTDYDSLSFHKIKETEKLARGGRYEILKTTTFYPDGKKRVNDPDGSIYEYAENGNLGLKAFPRKLNGKYYFRRFEEYDENGQITFYGYMGLDEEDNISGFVKCKNGAVTDENNWGDAASTCENLQKNFYKDLQQ
jgi:antitoxin component YwqK of YwqJK toxin-antitoxin module